MKKISFSSLKLKKDSITKNFKYEDKEIEVLQYLPFSQKRELVLTAIVKSLEGDAFIDPISIDMNFHLNLVYYYTNLTFTDKQKEKEDEIYDLLVNSGILDHVIENIPEIEYKYLSQYLKEYVEERRIYDQSLLGLIEKVINSVATNATQAKELLASINPESIKEVMNLVKTIEGDSKIDQLNGQE